MAHCITRHIPNAITCLNLFSGCVACVMAFRSHYDAALLCIVLSALFDFCDGLAARTLHAYSPIGKDLDSLADDISFGLAPSAILFALLCEMDYPDSLTWLPYSAFLIAVFSGLRLAKFNNDTRQTTSFIGLPVPANALFWAALVCGCRDKLLTFSPWLLVIGICLFSWLLVSEVPMVSLKFKNLHWRDNRVRFLFLLGCLPLLLLGVSGLALIIVWYILLSLCHRKG